MIIHHKGPIIPGYNIKVTCQDDLMLQMLASAPDQFARYLTETDLVNIRHGYPNNILYIFMGGAELLVCQSKSEYEVRHRLALGVDGLSAIAELKMLDNLRLAKKHYYDLRKVANIQGMSDLKVTQFPSTAMGFNIAQQYRL